MNTFARMAALWLAAAIIAPATSIGSAAVAMEDAVWLDAARGREVPVRIYAPALEHGNGPFPLVVFSHGGGESREAFTYLGTHWAKHGYIAVFLTHHGSDRTVIAEQGMRGMSGGGPANFHLRPEDVRFVLDKLLSKDPGSELVSGRLAAEHIAVAGQCAGATTALSMVGLRANLPEKQDATFIDARFTCAVALSPQPGGGPGNPLHAGSWAHIEVPTLMVTGTRDFNWGPAAKANPELYRVPFDGLPPGGDNYLVNIKDAEHNAFTDSVPYYPARERDPRHHDWIQQATTAFLDACLKNNAETRAWLRNEELEKATKGECMQEQKLAAPTQGSNRKSTAEPGNNDTESRMSAQDRTARLLRIFDRDNDQALSPEEAPDRLKTLFERIDRDRNGKLTTQELGSVLDRAGRRQDGLRELATGHGANAAALPPASGPHSVGVVEKLVLPDAQRNKDLTLRITYPEADGLFPVILFSHRVQGKRDEFKPLAEQWAANGYVVLQVDHADTGRMGAEWRDRARDMHFLIDSLAEIDNQLPEPAEIDAGRIGAGGHLIGSYAALALAGMKGMGFGLGNETADFTDPRVTAVLALGPQGRGQELDEESWADIDVPLFVAAGSGMPSRRTSNPPEWRTEPYRFAKPGDKYLLWVEGMDPGFAGLGPGSDIDPVPASFVRNATTAFWDAHLKNDTQARQRLHAWPVPEAEEERFRLESKGLLSSNPDKRQNSKPSSENGRYDFSRLDRFLEQSVSRLGGGCSFILIQGDRVIHRSAYGSFTPGKVVPIASASKWISGGVIMAPVDAGEISLDDPASRYLPCFTGKKADITIRQMFTHTHGLAGNARDHLWNTELTMDEAVRAIAKLELTDDPGTALYYSGLGMQAAGRICEIATGNTWDEIFKETLGDPLGMDSTDYFAFGPTKNPNVAGSVRTCIDDYGAYLTMLLNRGIYKGRRILSEKAVETMLSNQSGSLPILRHPYDVLDIIDPALAKAPYGIGCWLEDFDPETGKTTAITSGGAFGCMPFLDLKRNVAGVLLPHSRSWKTDARGRRYNDAHRVYYEARSILNGILDEGNPPRTAACQTSPSVTASSRSVEVHGDLAADYSAQRGGRAVLVMVDGKIAFERYDNGFGPDTATHLHSATKGFWGPVIAAMIEDGLIESFDEPATKTLPEWQDHPRKSRITLRHLLSLNAGLVQDVVNLQGHDRTTLATDLYKHAIGVRAAREPGAFFQYGPSCYYVLGEIMKRKLAACNQTPLDYLQQRILDPIGAKPGAWVHDASGNPHIPNGASFASREWMKFGQWLLQGGEWQGKQIVRKELLDELVKPSKTNPGHGLALWLNHPEGRGSHDIHRVPPGAKGGFIYNEGCTDLFAALGAGKCRLYVIPSFNMVALRQGDTPNDGYRDSTFLSLLLTGKAPGPTDQAGSNALLDIWLNSNDTNNDGKLDPNEAPRRIQQIFNRLDADNNGYLIPREIETFLDRAHTSRPRRQ